MQEITTTLKPETSKLWSIRQIYIGTFLAGPLTGCFLLSRNFKAFGNDKAAKQSLWYGLLATVLLIALLQILDFPHALRISIPGTMMAVIGSLGREYQKKTIMERLSQGSERNSYFKLIGVAVLSILIYLSIGILMAFLEASVSITVVQ